LFGPTQQPPSQPLQRLALWGWLVGFVLVSVALSCAAAEWALHFDSYAMDGPFQLFNALRRISVGQRIGDTFQFFHGPGIPYFFFPAFAMGGRTFIAAELSRQLISVGLFLASTLGLSRALAGTWRRALPIAIVAVIAMMEFRLDGLPYPLNSLLGVRSTMPLFVAVHLLMRSPGRRADLERGLLLGLALVLGTEQGIAAIAALAIARGVMALRTGDGRAHAWHFVVETATAVACFLLLVVMLAGSNAASVLRFNFGEVPRDQLWYFGAPPNAFLSRWDEILPMMAQRPRWWVTIAAATMIAGYGVWRADRLADSRRPTANLFLVVYGLISLTSMLGLFIPAYAQPATRVAVFVVLGWLSAAWDRSNERFPSGLQRVRPALPALGALALLLLSFVREPQAMNGIARAPVHVLRDHWFGPRRPQMSNAWVETQIAGLAQVEQVRRAIGHSPVIWSTYAGLLEWQVGVFHPATDYIIHALGPRRRSEYAAAFVAKHPDLVQTIRPGYIWYEEWLEGAHWDFYGELLERYDISASGPWSFFWTPRPGPPLPPGRVIFDTAVPAGAMTISADPHLPPDSIGVFEVRLRYRTHNPASAVPVLGGTPRYLIDLPGSANRYSVSLAPYATERSFPVVVRGGTPITVQARVASLLGGATITLDSVRIREVPVSRVNELWVRDFVTRIYDRQ
jgi:hypothetical protein